MLNIPGIRHVFPSPFNLADLQKNAKITHNINVQPAPPSQIQPPKTSFVVIYFAAWPAATNLAFSAIAFIPTV